MEDDEKEAREFQEKCDELARKLKDTVRNLERAIDCLYAGDPYAIISTLEGAAEDVYVFQKEIENFD